MFLRLIFFGGIILASAKPAQSRAESGMIDIGPNRGGVLGPESPGVKGSSAQIEILCEKSSSFLGLNACDKKMREGFYSSSAIDFCERDKSHFSDCLRSLVGRDFSEGAASFCLQIGSPLERNACAKYFSTTPSFFQKEALQLCLPLYQGVWFNKIKKCLDQIRDRKFEKADLDECKTAGPSLKELDSPIECLDRLAHSAPLFAEQVCPARERGSMNDKAPAAGSDTVRATK